MDLLKILKYCIVLGLISVAIIQLPTTVHHEHVDTHARHLGHDSLSQAEPKIHEIEEEIRQRAAKPSTPPPDATPDEIPLITATSAAFVDENAQSSSVDEEDALDEGDEEVSSAVESSLQLLPPPVSLIKATSYQIAPTNLPTATQVVPSVVSPPARSPLACKKLDAAIENGDTVTPVEPEALSAGWVYHNGAQDNVSYSHMAMVERLPSSSRYSYITVWQAADVVAGGRDMHIRASVSHDMLTWYKSHRIHLPQDGAIWAPVLYLSRNGTREELLLFYAESSTCIRDRPKLHDQAYAPGGTIKMVRSRDGVNWGTPKVVLSQDAEGGVPKVIANKPVLLESGMLLLPFWREDPSPISRTCKLAKACAKCVIEHGAPVGISGTLLSTDGGRKWTVGGNIKAPKGALLLEGTAVQLPNSRVLQFFRSTVGNVFVASSDTDGDTWTPAVAIEALPNPSSKVSAELLPGVNSTMIALAYNHHGSKIDGVKVSTRTRLRVAVSADEGFSWTGVAKLEEEIVAQTKFHYPTLITPDASGCQLGVVYTIGMKWRAGEGGVRFVLFDLDDL
ncbi:hypothetical protein CYMTET_16966 [Cymbomonas tetramitiformis]|uniref:Sialidase domain-containing protein n=1 Tax=Cymbomonas tetramitiformis TaxID=36881 RepID=A0AAE0L7M4_9CHLO|nr:hypothetical protein CYMTET_16966 [Cymbomonas tetramitiformis]